MVGHSSVPSHAGTATLLDDLSLSADQAPGVLTLGDLLGQRDLGLELVVGDETALARRIGGAHATDLPHPGSWLDRDWLVLMCGMSLRYEPSCMPEMFDELMQVGVSAVGFGLEPVFNRIPENVLSEARKRRLPVIAVPPTTPFRVVVERVFRATLSEDLRASQRLLAMQRYLVDALGHEHPQRTLLERLATLVHGDAALLTRDGQIDMSTSELPIDEIWPVIRSQPATMLPFELGDSGWVAARVLAHNGLIHRWLLIGAKGSPGSARAVKAAAHIVVPLLSAVAQLEASGRRQERAFRAAVLDRLLDDGDAPVSAAQLQEFGFTLGEELHVLLLAPLESGDAAARAVLIAFEEEASHVGVAFVTGVRDGRVVAVIQGRSEVGVRLFTESAASLAVEAVGVGEPVVALGDVSRALRHAEFAVDSARGQLGHVLHPFEDLGPADAVLADIPIAVLHEHADDMLRTLRTQTSPAVVETVRAFFEHRMSITETARALHLHPNSLRYRLGRAEKLLGRSLREPSTIAAIYLALRSDAVREDAR